LSKDLDLKQHIRSIPDFPKPGILFYDISTLLAHPKAWHTAIERLADLRAKGILTDDEFQAKKAELLSRL